MVSTLLFVGFILLVLLGIPIGFCMAISSVITLLFLDIPLAILCQRFFTSLDSFPLMAIPLFMFAGSLMSYGGITKRIIDFALLFVGGIKGSLSYVVAISGIIMGGISGSGIADTAALGSILIPEMKSRKYNLEFSAALVAASGSIGLIIPPSITMIIYAVTTQSSIGDLFMLGFIPGILIGCGFIIYSYFVAKKYAYPTESVSYTLKEKFKVLLDAIWALLMPFIIIVGIRGGIFTATEGASVVAVYALLVSLYIYKEITYKDIPKICFEAAISTATVSIIIASTALFSWLLAREQIPQQIAAFLIQITENRYVILLILNLILLVCGMFLDPGPAIMLLAPILLPVAQSAGVDTLQFGLMMILNLTIGLLTPPVGTALYVSSNISGIPITRLSMAMWPFWGIMILVLMLVTYIPQMFMWVL